MGADIKNRDALHAHKPAIAFKQQSGIKTVARVYPIRRSQHTNGKSVDDRWYETRFQAWSEARFFGFTVTFRASLDMSDGTKLVVTKACEEAHSTSPRSQPMDNQLGELDDQVIVDHDHWMARELSKTAPL